MPENQENEQMPKRYLLFFYAILLTLGVALYIAWGLMYGAWNIFERTNLGIYALTVLLVGFGITGIVLYSIGDKEEDIS